MDRHIDLPPDVDPPGQLFRLPFRREDGERALWVSNGWWPAPDQIAVMGAGIHAAVDFTLLNYYDGYGAPVVAAADGYAVYSYQYISVPGKPDLGIGAGLFVEVHHSLETPRSPGWVTQYCHLSSVAPDIPYLAPMSRKRGAWHPEELVHTPFVQLAWRGMRVSAGQVIGYMGDSGIGPERFEYNNGKVHRDRAGDTWDPPQLHFACYERRDGEGRRVNIVDPMGWYDQVRPGHWQGSDRHEHSPYASQPGTLSVSPYSIFHANAEGEPLYADD